MRLVKWVLQAGYFTRVTPTEVNMSGRVFKKQLKNSDGSIYESPYYYIEYYDDEGKQRRISTKSTSKKEAQAKLDILQGKSHDIKLGFRKKDAKIIHEEVKTLIDTYISECKYKLAPSTVSDYQSTLYELFVYTHAKPSKIHLVSISQLTFDMLNSWKFAEVRTKSKRTINKKLANVSAFCNWCVKHGRLESNPTDKVENFKEHITVRPFTKAEYETILSVSNEYDRKVWIVFAETGLRKGELARLKWEDINVESRLIHVKSTKDHPTKNKEERYVPMSDNVVSVFNSLTRTNPSDVVFKTIGNYQDLYSGAPKTLAIYMKKAGIQDIENLNVHSFRRYFVTEILERGANPSAVSFIVGHKTPSLVLKVYSKVTNDHARNAIALWDKPKGG